MKRFRVRMWEDMTERDPCEDVVIIAATHVDAVRSACIATGMYCPDWVRVEEESGYMMRFLDVSLFAGVLSYEASY